MAAKICRFILSRLLNPCCLRIWQEIFMAAKEDGCLSVQISLWKGILQSMENLWLDDELPYSYAGGDDHINPIQHQIDRACSKTHQPWYDLGVLFHLGRSHDVFKMLRWLHQPFYFTQHLNFPMVEQDRKYKLNVHKHQISFIFSWYFGITPYLQHSLRMDSQMNILNSYVVNWNWRHFVACGQDVKFFIHPIITSNKPFDSPCRHKFSKYSRVLLHPTTKCSPHMEPDCYCLKMHVLILHFHGLGLLTSTAKVLWSSVVVTRYEERFGCHVPCSSLPEHFTYSRQGKGFRGSLVGLIETYSICTSHLEVPLRHT